MTHCAWNGCLSLSDSHLRCSACRSAYYCSAEHQRLDWTSIHKGQCRSIRAMLADMKQDKSAGKFDVMNVGNVAFIG